MKIEKITWPAFIKYAADEELSYVKSASQWHSQYRTQRYLHGDIIVDSVGLCLALESMADPLAPCESSLTLAEVLEYVKGHASICGQCCVSKLFAPDIACAVRLVGVID